MQYYIISVTDYAENCLLIWSVASRQGALVDPGGEAARIKQAVAAHEVKISKILLTHGHLDHAGAAAELAAFYAVPVIGPQQEDEFLLQGLPQQSQLFGWQYCPPLMPDRWLNDGDTLTVGEETLQVSHCPGHTPGHVVFYVPADRLLICGDVLFKGGVGRSDFPRGNHNQLINSITQKLLPLGDDVVFVPGHGEHSTLGFERRYNPFLQPFLP